MWGLGCGWAFLWHLGLTVLTGAYTFGPISGGHFNPAVSVGLWAGGRFPASHVVLAPSWPKSRALLWRRERFI